MSLLDALQKTSGVALDPQAFDEDAIPGLVDEIFTTALEQRASDVHFKPKEEEFEVYFRVDGAMIHHKTFEKIYHHPIIARIKIISGLKIDEHRLPQDGKSNFVLSEGNE